MRFIHVHCTVDKSIDLCVWKCFQEFLGKFDTQDTFVLTQIQKYTFIRMFIHLGSVHPFFFFCLFQCDNLSKYHWIFIKLGMHIDIVDISSTLLMGQFCQFWQLSAHHTIVAEYYCFRFYLFIHLFIYLLNVFRFCWKSWWTTACSEVLQWWRVLGQCLGPWWLILCLLAGRGHSILVALGWG